jgi:hypothetical protein
MDGVHGADRVVSALRNEFRILKRTRGVSFSGA